MTSKVQTVLGDIDPSALGRTLTHEHLSMNFEHFYRKPPATLKEYFHDKPNLMNIGYIRQYPYSSKYNLKLDDDDAYEAVLSDVAAYKKFGGGAIVENTTQGLDRDVKFYEEVSETTGVHVIAGTGHYIEDLQHDNYLHHSTEEMYKDMLDELTVGCADAPNIKAGFMGEIASVWPIRDFERRVIRAAGELQPQVGCGVSFHPHRHPDAPFEIIRLYLEAGGAADKAVMSHLDRTLLEDDTLLKFAEQGTYCQFDLFGVEVSYYQLNVATDMMSDAQRINKIKLLIEEDFIDRILMSHDIHTKHRLINFGGHGYAHILNNVLPKMKSKGISQSMIDTITIKNPADWLSISS
ncbi:unnamed protein product [Chrysodeixis includens]|uniref:Phosphotriesterase-related protein n=1 Tax=Chrysodeixis includens TaxID=689277 RepID=A0A9P0BNN7_CHRIL|nr:unnamed protein product [Chrysodeixis includens]